ncbi:MAG: DUF262 domain-containing protein [Chloroflexota bacterium]|nr:MAG: hypothetical protein DLM70_17240 [Chloroflexota bacterium]
MQASTSSLNPILGGQNQYIIPLFQRYYSWERKNWEALWEGVTELMDVDALRRQHFMGPLVFVPAVKNVITPTILVIDGQQRLMTLSLLLCELRDVAAQRGYEGLAKEIEGKFLVDPFHRDAEHLHVLPRQRDRDDYIAAVLRKHPPTGKIAKALMFFTDRISTLTGDQSEEFLRTFLTTTLAGLEFVVITLDHENAFEIFRSLNATGVPLSQSDLIRNFVFMHVEPSEQIEFDDRYWQPLEEMMGPVQTRSATLTSFFRDFLMKDGRYVSPSATFARFEEHYSGDNWTAEGLAEELTR